MIPELASKSSLFAALISFPTWPLCGCCIYAVITRCSAAVALKLQRLPGSKRECLDTSIKVQMDTRGDVEKEGCTLFPLRL